MNLTNQIRILLILFPLFFTTICWGQILNKGLIFADDLNVVAQEKSTNLISVGNDEVRALVVKFDPNKNAHFINNERDTAISVSFWLRPQNIQRHPGAILGEQNVFYFRYLSNKQLQFNLWKRMDIETPAVLTEDQWQHIGFTLNKKGHLNIYFNGDLITRDSIPDDWWKKKEQVVLGKDMYGVGAEGFMDELRIWNKTLTEKEIKEEYNRSGLHPSLTYGLKLYLPLANDCRNLANNKIDMDVTEHITFPKNQKAKESAYFVSGKSYAKVDNITFDAQKTIALWIKPTNNESPLALIGNSDFSFRYLSKTKQLWYSVPMKYGIKSKPSETSDNQWIHVAISLNYNHKIDYYLNGIKIDSQPIESGTGNANTIEIGRSFWNDSYDGNMSEIAIWNRKLSDEEIKEVYNGKLKTLLPDKKTSVAGYLVPALSLMLLAVIFVLQIKRKKSNLNILRNAITNEFPLKNAVYFLQKFRAYNNDGEDISNEFSPTLIRLFALILLYPKVYQRNVSSFELSDILWPDESPVLQKNNRSTNIHRLRTIFKRLSGLDLNYQNKTWQIKIDKTVFIDIESFTTLLQQLNYKSSVHNIKLDNRILTNGFDTLVRLYDDKRLSTLAQKCEEYKEIKDWGNLAYFSKLWLSIDTLSDEAIKLQVNALLHLKQKQKALNAYNAFCQNYALLLNEKYSLNFEKMGDC